MATSALVNAVLGDPAEALAARRLPKVSAVIRRVHAKTRVPE